MMRHLLLLSLIGLCACGRTKESLNIDSSKGFVYLEPTKGTGWSEVEYTIKATQKGSKLVAFCTIYERDCDINMVRVNTGEGSSLHCRPEWGNKLHNTSSGDTMIISMGQDMGDEEGSYCRVAATKPYLHVVDEEIDSSEHGVATSKSGKTTCDCGWANKDGSRIVGGREALENEYPFVVGLYSTEDEVIYCGGSIITSRHILTAAHCFPYEDMESEVFVRIGEHHVNKVSPHEKVFGIKSIILHDLYEHRTGANDIAIVELKEEIPFSKNIGRVCLPSSRVNVGDYVKVMGWGLDDQQQASETLRKVNLKVIDSDVCKTVYPVTSGNQFCTFSLNRDSCQGDSGGPLVWVDPKTNRYTQMGLVSFGRKCGKTDPAINTDVFQYLDWIEKAVSNRKKEMCKKA